MSESPNRRTDDLEETFSRLVGDVERRSSQPGAAGAVRTARRRRTALVAAVAAAAVVAASAVGGGLLLTGGREVPAAGPVTPPSAGPATSAPVRPSTDPAYPSPEPMTVRRLQDTSRDWVQGWTNGEPAVQPSSCVGRQLNRAAGGDTTSGDRWFRADGEVTARLSRRRLVSAQEADRLMSVVYRAVETCTDDRETILVGYSAGTEARSISFGEGAATGTTWFVIDGNRLSVFTVAGPAATTPDGNIDRDLTDVLVADLRAW